MKNILKHLLSLVVLSVLIVPVLVMTLPTQARAETGRLDLWGDPITEEGFAEVQLGEIGLGKKDPRTIAINIIQILLGLLGIIAVVIILMGGFKWMTAGGNEDNVAQAKKLLGAGVIGLLVVLAAWALAMFIIGRFLYATTSSGGDISGLPDIYKNIQ